MSSTTKHALGIRIATVAALVMVACAQGVGGEVGDDDDDVDAKAIDAPQVVDAPQPIDARVIDASQPIDARIIDASPLIDAPILPPDGGGGLICNTTADCGPGTCCFPPGGPGVCFPGSEPLPGLCLPGT
jgi:hypothetical protein